MIFEDDLNEDDTIDGTLEDIIDGRRAPRVDVDDLQWEAAKAAEGGEAR